MNIDISNLKQYMTSNYSSTLDTFENISRDNQGNAVVSSSSQAYNFDTIVRLIFPAHKCPKSADALLIKDEIYFIEFKSGKNNTKEKKLSTIGKLCSSMLILENYLLKQSGINISNVKINFLLVEKQTSNPINTYSAALSKLSNFPLFADGVYEQKIQNQRIYYDSAFRINDINFDTYLLLIK